MNRDQMLGGMGGTNSKVHKELAGIATTAQNAPAPAPAPTTKAAPTTGTKPAPTSGTKSTSNAPSHRK